MTLDEIILDLKSGELNKHGMFMDHTLTETYEDELITHINIGLTELYTRFPLLNKDVNIQQLSWVTTYYLDSKHAVTNTSSTEAKYIIDSDLEPFTDDVIRIEGVYDEVGDSLLMNSTAQCKVALTPSMNAIEIPNPTETNMLFIVYRAKHPIVSLETPQLLLPYNFKPALLAYVAHRVYSGGTTPEHVTMAMNMYQKYELICTQQREYGMTNQDENYANETFVAGGWI